MIDLPTIAIEANFTLGASTGTLLQLDDPTRGRLDTGTLGATSTDAPVWTDISDYVMSWSTSRGSTRVDGPLLTYTGTATITLDNSDRRFDPSNLSGPYVDPVTGTTQLTPMRAIRILATWNSVTYEVFRGFADNWDVSWSGPGWSECALTVSDAFKIFSGVNRPAVTPVGASETTGARINRILDNLNWPTADRNIATGDTTVQTTDLSGVAMSELQLVADTEAGELYIDAGGRVLFRNRQAVISDSRSNTSQGTFGDTSAELPYDDLSFSTDDVTFYNQVRVTRVGGTEQMVTNATAIALLYPKTFTPSSQPIMETDAVALSYAQWLLYISATPELRFTSMAIKAWQQSTDLYPQVLGRLIGDRITVVRRPPGGGTITQDCFIRGIAHDWSASTFTTTWTLQSATKYGNFFRLDDPILGVLDTDALAY